MDSSPILKMLSRRRLSWTPSFSGDSKVETPSSEVESFKQEIAYAEERESYLQSKLNHIDEILRSALLSSYLHTRTRWTELPGEPPILDDVEVDDWLPQFVVFGNSSIFFYQKSTDLNPQESIFLSDIVEVGPLPSFSRADDEAFHGFYILTNRGSKAECASPSKLLVDSWLTLLQRKG